MLKNILLFFLSLLHHKPLQLRKEVCQSSEFGTKDDRYSSPQLACPPYKLTDSLIGIAHRTLPCGTLLFIRNPRTNKVAFAKVIDRGPYGAGSPKDGTWYVKKHYYDPPPTCDTCEPLPWRGCADLTQALIRKLDHNTWEPIEIFYLK